ncbi:MAG: histidine--tRNA ligase [Planctomycetota bacterium]|nr:MAG: histidine--tRNA ligase [Planctomycetota bacterium]REJ91060.1 MAG: histidine--tRNA ligase [Planctomycetota bacterium]REK31084.1 MAG: histidine--tRNA ligase [Planctomycetota bacterium]REK36928.1 MAG: histidine--tRNA ligase [Planctomycetota bacterium]
MIKPQTLKGFRDYLPGAALAREKLTEIAREVYRSYGFSPIDTPALEYSQILLGKGGDESDKQLFRFTDQGERDVAMRFDLTVPFARFAAQHLNDIGTPFKRYHIGTVWRAEKPQRGRYREFMQCDFDTIGTDSNASDIETLLVIHDLMERIGFTAFTIRVNHRKLLNGLLESLGLADKSAAVLRALDKLPKIGADAVTSELTAAAGTSSEQAEKVLAFAGLTGAPEQILTDVEKQLAGNETGLDGVARLRELFDCAAQAGLPSERIALDVSIARGLDYYTGTIYETFLNDLPQIGSVCSGGRYDNLAGLFTRQPLPGVGASLGLDRLLAAMEELGLTGDVSTPAEVLIVFFDANHTGRYMRLGRLLRQSGIAAEVFPQAKALKKQLQYADRKGFRVALIAGDREFADGVWQVKDLQQQEQQTVADDGIVEAVRGILASA